MLPAPAIVAASTIFPSTLKRPVFMVGALDEVDGDRPHERVALVAGVLASGVAQLVDERLVDLAELLEVARG